MIRRPPISPRTYTLVPYTAVFRSLSVLMRLQLGFPDTFSFITPENYLQHVSMHGMIMVVYLLTALFLGGFGNYLIPLMVGARDMVFPFVNMLSFWFYLLAVLILVTSFFVPGGPTGAGWTLYPPQAILEGTPGNQYGIILMLVRSEEHTSELQSLMRISYAVFCLKKKNNNN